MLWGRFLNTLSGVNLALLFITTLLDMQFSYFSDKETEMQVK